MVERTFSSVSRYTNSAPVGIRPRPIKTAVVRIINLSTKKKNIFSLITCFGKKKFWRKKMIWNSGNGHTTREKNKILNKNNLFRIYRQNGIVRNGVSYWSFPQTLKFIK